MIRFDSGFCRVQEPVGRDTDRPRQHDQLDHVDAALATLDARDQGLMTAQPSGKLLLAELGIAPGLDQGLAQGGLA